MEGGSNGQTLMDGRMDRPTHKRMQGRRRQEGTVSTKEKEGEKEGDTGDERKGNGSGTKGRQNS